MRLARIDKNPKTVEIYKDTQLILGDSVTITNKSQFRKAAALDITNDFTSLIPTHLSSAGSERMVCIFPGATPSKAALVGANTVKGPGSVRRVIRPESLRAAMKVEKRGLKTRRSSREQAGAQEWGTAAASCGGLTGPGRPDRLGRCRG